jgi:cytochrome P450
MSSTILDGPRGSVLRGCSTALDRDFLGFLAQSRATYGRAFRIRVSPGWHAIGLLSPHHYEHVLMGAGDGFVKETREAVMLRNMLGRSVLTDNGERQRRSRSVAQPALNGRSVRAMSPLVGEIVSKALNDMAARTRSGAPFDIQEEMTVLTIRIASGALLGNDDPDLARRLSAAFWHSNRFLSERIARPLGPLAASIPSIRNRGYFRAKRELDAIADQLIDAARRSGGNGTQLIDRLAREGFEGDADSRLRSEVKTFLFSGHETSSTTLTWFWYFVLKDPQLHARVVEEVDRELNGRRADAQSVTALKLTERVICEVLRFYPPGYIIGRKAIRDDDGLGFTIPAGIQVYMSPYLTHRDPEYWTRPAEFDPDRFEPEIAKQRPRFAYLPFGAGSRRCLGDSFASLELLIIVATMAQRFRLRLLSPTPVPPEPLLTIRPTGGLIVEFKSR